MLLKHTVWKCSWNLVNQPFFATIKIMNKSLSKTVMIYYDWFTSLIEETVCNFNNNWAKNPKTKLHDSLCS